MFNCRHKELLEQEKLFSAELTQYDQAVLGVHMANIEWTKRLFPYKPLDTHHINLPEVILYFRVYNLLLHGSLNPGKPRSQRILKVAH